MRTDIIEQATAIAGAMRRAVDVLPDSTAVIDCELLVEPWTPGAYVLDDVRAHAGQVWRCCQAHDSAENPAWAPGTVPALWTPLHTKDPDKAKPFIQPTGAHDAYMKDECCVFEGQTHRSKNDNNAYSPTDYPQGWELISA